MDYNDYIDNSDDDHSYNVEDDDEWYDLVVARGHVTETYYMKYIDKQPCRDSDQTFYKWLMDCWLVMKRNVMKCLERSRMFFFNCAMFYNIDMDFNTQGILGLKSQ